MRKKGEGHAPPLSRLILLHGGEVELQLPPPSVSATPPTSPKKVVFS
jgi:hypothetical protein